MRFVKTIVIALASYSLASPSTALAGSPPATGASDAAQSGADAKTYSIQPQTGSRVPVPGHTEPEPSVIEVVRPERTIVRDVDEALPLTLSGTALLLALAGVGFTLIRTRTVPRPGGTR